MKKKCRLEHKMTDGQNSKNVHSCQLFPHTLTSEMVWKQYLNQNMSICLTSNICHFLQRKEKKKNCFRHCVLNISVSLSFRSGQTSRRFFLKEWPTGGLSERPVGLRLWHTLDRSWCQRGLSTAWTGVWNVWLLYFNCNYYYVEFRDPVLWPVSICRASTPHLIMVLHGSPKKILNQLLYTVVEPTK